MNRTEEVEHNSGEAYTLVRIGGHLQATREIKAKDVIVCLYYEIDESHPTEVAYFVPNK